MDPRDLEDLGNADEAEADPESSSEVSYDDGDMDMHEDEGMHNESDALKALEEHAEHEAKFGHVKLKEIHEIDTSAALEKVRGTKAPPKVSILPTLISYTPCLHHLAWGSRFRCSRKF